MSKERELLESCLDEMQYHNLVCPELKIDIKELLAQPEQTEQEPVAWITEWVQRYRHNDTPVIDRAVSFTKGDAPAVPNPNYIPLYTAPSKREQTEQEPVPTVAPMDFNFYSHMFESAYVRSMREELARSINEANKRESKDTEDTEDKLQDLATYVVSFSKGGKRIDRRDVYISTEPEQEPVAWMWTRNYEGGGYTNKVFEFLNDAEEYAKDSKTLKSPDIIRPLYTTPPKREPLSTKQAEDLWETTFKSAVPYYIFDEICGAIEQYHGIGGGE